MAKTRIFLECSNTWESDCNTGIQRTVRNIVKEAPDVENFFGVKSVPIIVKFNRFWQAGEKPMASLSKARYWIFLKRSYYKIRPLFKRFSSIDNVESLFVLYSRRFVSATLSIIFFPTTLKFYFQPKIIPGKEDVLLLLDSSWMYPVWPAVKKAKNDGVFIGIVLYDIIPLTNPDFFPTAIVRRFNDWFKQALGHVDFFICISETVQNELKKYVKQNYPGFQMKDRVGFFTLGCSLDNISEDSSVSNKLKEIFKVMDIFIAVGTIESRKNHKYLLDAFDLVWKECPGAILCIIGKMGWLSEQVMKRIERHPLFKKNLFMFNNVSDTELDYCYRHSRALISSSQLEGFGLPIVEALRHGLPVLVSDIPVHRETGKDFCTYFDINNSSCLAKIIVNIEKTGKMPQVRSSKEYKLTTWKDSCRELFARIQALSSTVT